MTSILQDLSHFSSQYGQSLDSDDAAVVLEAELALAGVCTPQALATLVDGVAGKADSHGADAGPGREWNPLGRARRWASSILGRQPTFLDNVVPVVVAADRALTHTLGGRRAMASFGATSLVSGLIPPLGWFAAHRSNEATNQTLLQNHDSSAWSSLSTVVHLEQTLTQTPTLDWGCVALNYVPVLESALCDPLFQLGRAFFEADGQPTHRFYGEVLRLVFERGFPPTLVSLEAIAYFAQKTPGARALMDDLGPLGRRYYAHPKLLPALGRARHERNALVHPGRSRWSAETYGAHCQRLFGTKSLSDWLETPARQGKSGFLSDTGEDLLGALLVCKTLWKRSQEGPDIALSMLLDGTLAPADFSELRLAELLRDSSLEQADELLKAGVVQARHLDSDWRRQQLSGASIEQSLNWIKHRWATPADFAEPWRERAATRSSWAQMHDLIASGLLEESRCSHDLIAAKLARLSMTEVRRLLKSGAVPVTLLPKMGKHLRPDNLSVADAIWVAEQGWLQGAQPSLERTRIWARKANKQQAAALVRLGLMKGTDLPP